MTDAPWTTEELATLRADMIEERQSLLARVADHHRHGPICGDAADQATFAVESELDDLSEARDRDLLAQVESILDRIERGVYDTCDSCGGPIARARQEAYPRAATCLDCAQSARPARRTP